MKRFVLTAFLLLAAAYGVSAFPITNYDTRMDIQKDSNVLVTETITADFTNEPHHGIYRDIPLGGKDSWGNNYNYRISNLQVTDMQGNPLQRVISYQNGDMHIRIGDPNVYVNGIQSYVIKYHILRAVHFFKDHDELYWNVVGPEWEVPISQATATVTIPGKAKRNLRTTVYTGYYGSTGSDAKQWSNCWSASFRTTKGLGPSEGVTIVVGWPKGIVKQPSFNQNAKLFILDNGYFFLPPIFLACLTLLWIAAGRDPMSKRSVMVAYEPPDNLSPAEIGTLIDEKADVRDISATIVDLAVRGFIRIKVFKQKGFLTDPADYTFELVHPYDETKNDPNLSEYEVALVKAIFGGADWKTLSELKGNFYPNLSRLQELLYGSLIKRGYFTHSPETVRLTYIGWGAALMIVGIIISIASLTGVILSLGWGIAIILCGISMLAMSKAMPRKTQKGIDAFVAVKGFEEYLSRAERENLEYQERQNLFEKFLPYAMALGISDKWARAFNGLEMKPPEWYITSDNGNFDLFLFSSDLDHAAGAWGGTLATQQRTGFSGNESGFFDGGSGFSGGFSGGGGGGGGGGGW